MTFPLQQSILLFILFSIISTIIHYIIPYKFRLAWLLFTNISFYFICSGYFVVLLISLVTISWYCSNKIRQSLDVKQKRKWLLGGIIPTILVLCFFKYNQYFISNLKNFVSLRPSVQVTRIILPLGLSYYSFKIISYLVDVYYGKIEDGVDFIRYCTYVTLFTQITSGPISRFNIFYKTICEEEFKYKDINIENGFYHIILGLYMKVVIANRLAQYVSTIFATPEKYPGLALWFAAFFYSIELYCDFGGYSYLAIGLTELLGLKCEQNFQRPYLAQNIKDFWNRWHISLSSWLRDYVYIPLGGSRCSKLRNRINILLTFLVSGIWHGAGWNFIIWGVYHGLLNIITRKTNKSTRKKSQSLIVFANILCNIVLVDIAWIFFGLPNISQVIKYFKGMLLRTTLSISSFQASVLPFSSDNTCIAFFLTVMIFIGILFIKEIIDEMQYFKNKSMSIIWQIFLVVSILLYGIFGESGFIYANF